MTFATNYFLVYLKVGFCDQLMAEITCSKAAAIFLAVLRKVAHNDFDLIR